MGIEVILLLCVGFIAAMPPGPVLVLVLQKTLCKGRSSGFCTGLGSMCADALFAVVGLYSLGYIQSFVDRHPVEILLAGGSLVMLVGVLNAFRRKPIRNPKEREPGKFAKLGYAAQAFGCAISNPGALALMLALLTFFSLDSASLSCPMWLAVLCVAAGEALYWMLLTGVLSSKLSLGERSMKMISRWGGVILMFIGLMMICRGLIMIF